MSISEADILEWQTKLETTFKVNGITGGNILPLIDLENNFSESIVAHYYGQVVLLDSFQGFFLETLNNAYDIVHKNGWKKEYPQYHLVLAYFTACFKSFRASEILFHKGYATNGYTLLRSLKERAIYLCGVVNNITTITKMTAYASADLQKPGADKKKKEIEAEEKRIMQKILRKQSGLNSSDIRELSKWEQLFNAETHGAKFSLADILDGMQNGDVSILYTRELTLALYMNRVCEIGWMFTRLLPYLQPYKKAFEDDWGDKWKILDESFLINEQSLSELGKKIADSFIVLINSKFAFDENFYYFEADGSRQFGQMNGKLNIPNDFNNESAEINAMFYDE